MPVTLAFCLTFGHRMEAHCRRCGHHAPLDLRALRARFGPELDQYGVWERLVCSACGSRDSWLNVRYTTPGFDWDTRVRDPRR